jgi:GTP-binding protein HflX
LIDSFRATLEEVVGADLLLHVVDASDINWREKIQQVNSVLGEIQCDQIPQVLCFNKSDLLAEEEIRMLPQTALRVSSKTKSGIDSLLEKLSKALGVNAPYSVRIRAEDGASRSWLYSTGAVLDEELAEDSALRFRIQADDWLVGQIKKKGLAIDVEEVAALSRVKRGDV